MKKNLAAIVASLVPCGQCGAAVGAPCVGAHGPWKSSTHNIRRQAAKRARRERHKTTPPIVVLCGSTRFFEEWMAANFRETMKGKIVLGVAFAPGVAEHGQTVGITPEQKLFLDELYRRKIDLCDE